jgi:hypothetical protein
VTGRFCGPPPSGPVMERPNTCARIGGHPPAIDDQTVRRSPDPATDGLTDSSALRPAYSGSGTV